MSQADADADSDAVADAAPNANATPDADPEPTIEPDSSAQPDSSADAAANPEPDHGAQPAAAGPDADATLYSSRHAAPDADATLYSSRRAAPDDDATVLSTRGFADGAPAAPGEGGDDATVLARNPARGSQGGPRGRSGALPPDAPTVQVDRGHFGEQPSTYTPRGMPRFVTVEPSVPTPVDGLPRPPSQIPEPQRHREAQRHRKLILTAVIVAAGAAALTAAIVGVVALARGLS